VLRGGGGGGDDDDEDDDDDDAELLATYRKCGLSSLYTG